ncbi:Lysophospholipase NTE1 [Candida viswanathii]|uniref:Lysophospholipase NTE1 n=1 Tax=Candida viswanathii TaxID=5486 RepID=A0A367XW77_9ASCO|nr:Lysophospholipase NTE1 [Candida viswanathii]
MDKTTTNRFVTSLLENATLGSAPYDLFYTVSHVLGVLQRVVFQVLNFLVIEIPAFFIRLLSIDFQFSLHLSSLLLIVLSIGFLVFFVIRYKYLNSYSIPDNSTTQDFNHLNVFVEKSKLVNNPRNYLSQFMQGIKVFGYLEKSVFHELTKSMYTQKLTMNEVLILDESVGFLVVVEGVAQVYTKVSKDTRSRSGGIDPDFFEDTGTQTDEFLTVGKKQYQLLNEVKSGTPLSSLFSTLELFQPKRNLPLTPREEDENSVVALNFDCAGSPNMAPPPPPPPITEDSECNHEEYPEIIIRPKKLHNYDTVTIAIIPQSAFERVHMKYPKATSRIVAMVFTRLYKVTMNTLHNYLGLTGELLKLEIKLNEESVITNLPKHLVNGLLEKLSKPQVTEEDNLPKKTKLHHHRQALQRTSSRYVLLDSKLTSNNPGDLLSSVPISRDEFVNKAVSKSSTATLSLDMDSGKTIRRANFTDEIEETEENSLRVAIVENIFKIIGIKDQNGYFVENAGENRSLSSSSSSSILGLNRLSQSVLSTPSMRPSLGVRRSGNLMNTINLAELNGEPPVSSSPSPPILEVDAPAAARREIANKKRRIPDMSIKDAFSNHLEIKHLEPNSTIVRQDSITSGLYYVIDGELEVYHHSSEANSPNRYVYSVESGGIAGYLTSVVGLRSLVTIKTPKKSGAVVAYLSRSHYNSLLDKYYFLQLPVALRLKNLLSKQIITIDYALEWCHIPAGEVLFSQGDSANGFHVVLSGRFRAIRSGSRRDKHAQDEDVKILGEYGHGESIGEVEVLTATKRSHSLVAVRDSETARIPRSLFEMLANENPSIMVRVSRLVASKVLTQGNEPPTRGFITSSSSKSYTCTDYKTITILPTVSGLPVRQFAEKLVHAFKLIGRNVIALDQALILTHLGRHAFDESLSRLKMLGYFAYLEEEYETIVYICDTAVQSNWTSTCISQGDCILLLADAEDENNGVGEYEQLLVKLKNTARTDLCLIHQEKFVTAGSTSPWLKNRIWVQGHHHIQMKFDRGDVHLPSKKSFISDLANKISQNKTIKSTYEATKQHIRWYLSDDDRSKAMKMHKDDFMRLARILSNEAVGLVLGGGGSRGISHVGVVTALERHGIPVDIIGGTSIGSFVGGLYAKDYNIVSIYAMAKKFSKRVSSLWRMIFDLTYPVTSYITGYEFNRGIWKVFGFTEIEDFWIKYYCNSTNITNSTMDIHETGYAWRFIRASMSLCGLLPPITFKGCMLLDGGYLDNLPVIEMKKRGVKHIIAVDVGSADDRTPMNYGDTLLGFWVLFNRWNPFSKHPNVPSMMEIQLRLTYVSSVNALEEAKRTADVYYLRPPIDGYATLDFGKFDEIYKVGLKYADDLITDWKCQNKLPAIAGLVEKNSSKEDGNKRILYRRNSI